MPEISASTPVALGLLIILGGLIAAAGAAFWRVGRAEQDIGALRVALEHARGESSGLQTSMARLEAKVDVLLGKKSNA